MFDFRNYQWYHWLLFTAFVISLYWFWVLYLLVALVVLGAYLDTGQGRSRSRVRRAKPHKFKRRKQPVYRPVRHKTTKPHRFPKTRRKWSRPVKIDKVWKL